MAGTVREVVTPMPERLAKAAAAVDEDRLALALSLRQRDELVRESVDGGHLSQRATAAAAGVTVPRVSAILAKSADDEDDE